MPPAPGDSGTAIGAALAAHLDVTGVAPGGPVRVAATSARPTRTSRRRPAPQPGLPRGSWPTRPGSWRLSSPTGKIVGLFQGRLEAGPRALGNRSILASPLLPDVAGPAERRGEVP